MSTRNIIAVGGSLGGIDAAKHLLAALPTDFPAAVFITIHVGSSGLNAMAKVLGGRSTISAKTAVDGEPVQAGQIYVAPADHHLMVLGDIVRLGAARAKTWLAPPSILCFARSASAVEEGRLALC
jgi:two-component system chemotaxis response regulator CheB